MSIEVLFWNVICMLKRTPLYEVHKKLGARLVEFGGWEMPVQYTGVMEEHRAVRERVGLFDISHMGEIFVTGEKAQEFINHLTTNDIRRIQDGGCQYAACCYENGGVVDDVISYQYNPKKYLVVVNASNTDKDFEWFQKQNQFGVKIENKSPEHCQLALQGPLAQQVLQKVISFNLTDLKYYNFCETVTLPLSPSHRGRGDEEGKKIILSRTGYTGEDGFEIYGAATDALFLWETLMQAGKEEEIAPIGLAARDTLRLESAYSLYGHEISDTINPLEARLAWIVRLGSRTLDKSQFIGQKSLERIKAEGIKRKIIGIEMIDAGVPRQGYKIFAEGKEVGVVTSGTFSPTLQKGIALVLVNAKETPDSGELAVEVRGQQRKGKIVSLPFYKRGK